MTATTRRTLQGPAVRDLLAAHGIEAESVTRNRRTGVYTAHFKDLNLDSFYSKGTHPARVWAERIQEALPMADIIDGYDSVAEWRPEKPVLFALVTFTLPAALKKEAVA